MGAFQRARYVTDPARLLRLLLFHAVNDGGLRQTVAQARGSGIATMSQPEPGSARRRPLLIAKSPAATESLVKIDNC